MKRLGITGGIGSGKTTVAEIFKQLGISVYSSDERAKFLMLSDVSVKLKIIKTFGDESYSEGKLNRTFIAGKVFSNQSELNKLNAIVHPALKRDFDLWCLKQNGIYILKEAAILLESMAHIGLDKVILVSAPKELKISRVLKRDKSTRKDVLLRIEKQWSDEKKRALSDFEILNDEQESVIKQVLAIHKYLCELA